MARKKKKVEEKISFKQMILDTAEEKGISVELVHKTIEEAMLTAYKKTFGHKSCRKNEEQFYDKKSAKCELNKKKVL